MSIDLLQCRKCAEALQHVELPKLDKQTTHWFNSLHNVTLWVSSTGKQPHLTSEDAGERTLARWIYAQRVNERKGIIKFGSWKEQFLDTHIPDWGVTPDDKWLERAHELQEFVETHDAFPSTSRFNKQEHELGAWMQKQRATLEEGSWRWRKMMEIVPAFFLHRTPRK